MINPTNDKPAAATNWPRSNEIGKATAKKRPHAMVAIHVVAIRSMAVGQKRRHRSHDNTPIQPQEINAIAPKAVCSRTGSGLGSVVQSDSTTASAILAPKRIIL